ncbi:alpha/beta hydrolase-fold protein [Pseudoalteromonas sp. T1lg22]|uniref:alpha/beta hydrolase-fold protein n=1 Tax=Pseudoalteromonas sp. T1lg22 TaxID=2077096 RepID=UPI003FA3877C
MSLLKPTCALLMTFFVATLTSTMTLAQEQPDNIYSQHTEIIQSKVLGEERSILVQLPKSYHTNPDKVYPVIYRLDGASNLPLLTAVIERLQNAQSAPEVIIVAIENTNRLRDLYPTVNQDPRGPVGLGGGGAKFLDFFERELIPLVDNKYRTHDFRVIAGASAAGVFALYALQTKPELFQAHIAYSPAVWWNHGASAKSTKEFIAKAKTLNSYVYMNIGEEGGDMRAVYDDLHKFMMANKPKNLTLVTNAFDDVAHALTSSAGIFNAYHHLFMPRAMPVQAFTGELDSITDYYARLSQQYGEQIAPPEQVIRELGYHFVFEDDFTTAIKLFKFNIELHPKSADAYNGLAFAYERNGQYKDSLQQVNMALELSKEDDAGYDFFIQRRDRLLPLVKGTQS